MTGMIPYGISDFEVIRKKNYLYIDKTRFLAVIEKAGHYLFFLRPRRFGKSLLLSVLETYYDIAKKDSFDLFFKNTAIHTAPTEERNAYLVLKFNFSAVDPGMARVNASFLNNVKTSIHSFFNKYMEYFSAAGSAGQVEKLLKTIERQRSASDILHNALSLCKSSGFKLYILIDEYDNFSNTILSAMGTGKYKKLTQGSGVLRSFFSVIKDGTTGSDAPVSRLFVTGVSPITMDDVTSGFNIGKNISGDRRFNQLLGFSPEEVRLIIDGYRRESHIRHSTEALMEIMGRWYNHYRFSRNSADCVFNTDMVLFFMDRYLSEEEIPEELVDENVKIDYPKLKHLLIIDRKSKKRTNGNFSRLKQIVEQGGTLSRLKKSFSVEKLTHVDNFISLLFYFGLLTIAGREKGKIRLNIPNETVKRLFFEYIKDGYEETGVFSLDFEHYSELMTGMAYDGKWEPLFDYLTGLMKESMSLRDLMSGEKALQAFLAVYLGLGDMFLVHTEKELNMGYADILLEPFFLRYPDIGYAYLLELKYIKPAEFSQGRLQQVIGEAEHQLKNYAADKRFAAMAGNTQLIELVLVFSGHRLKYIKKVSPEI